MDAPQPSWTEKAEAAIRTLRDVEGASVHADGDQIREIHVVTSSKRPAKQIVRDVQSLLAAGFQQSIDHRVVSVAYTDAETRERPSAETNGDAPGREDPRIRFVSANLLVSGPRVQAQVELRWHGTKRMGSASGWSTREGAYRLVATAAIAALQDYLPGEPALSLEGVEFVRLGRQTVAVVAVELITHREHKSLVGCCTVGEDRQQSVVLATLAAVNRLIGGLPVREPAEHAERPTSIRGG